MGLGAVMSAIKGEIDWRAYVAYLLGMAFRRGADKAEKR